MSLRIMAVDNDPSDLQTVRAFLTPLNCQVLGVTDSRSAESLLESEKFDTFFIDVHMAHMDGIELTRRIRASSLNQKTPIVMLAGREDLDPMQAGFKAGATFFLGKPVTLEGVSSLVKLLRGLVTARETGAARTLVAPVTEETPEPNPHEAPKMPVEEYASAVDAVPAAVAKARYGMASRALVALGIIATLAFLLLHHASGNSVSLRAAADTPLSLKDLQHGIDVSQALGLPAGSVQLWIRRTWLSGLEYKMTVTSSDLKAPVSLAAGNWERLPEGWEVNANRHAVELVDVNGRPRLQILESQNYDLSVNAVMFSGDQATLLQNGHLESKPVKSLTRSDFPEPMFQYPAFMHHGELR